MLRIHGSSLFIVEAAVLWFGLIFFFFFFFFLSFVLTELNF